MSGAENLAFRQGRESVFHKIMKDLDATSAHLMKTSRIFVQDCLPYELSDLNSPNLTDKQKADFAFLCSASEIIVEAMADQMKLAVEGLWRGHSVYSLLGKDSVPTYAAITNGDSNAGILSAVEDITVMLMSLNYQHLIDQVFHDVIESKDFDVELAPTLRQILRLSANTFYDHILMGMNTDIINKLHQPNDIEYEDGRLQKKKTGALVGFFKWVASAAHHSGRDARRASKIGPIWPPLNISFTKGVAPETISAAPQFDTPPFEIPDAPSRHNHLDFKTGYSQVMLGFYHTLQSRHFDAMARKNYAARSGLPVIHEKQVQSTAQVVFDGLRENVKKRIAALPNERGSFREGIYDALGHIQREVSLIDLPPRGKDSSAERILGKLKESWITTLREVVMRVEREGIVFTSENGSIPQPL